MLQSSLRCHPQGIEPSSFGHSPSKMDSGTLRSHEIPQPSDCFNLLGEISSDQDIGPTNARCERTCCKRHGAALRQQMVQISKLAVSFKHRVWRFGFHPMCATWYLYISAHLTRKTKMHMPGTPLTVFGLCTPRTLVLCVVNMSHAGLPSGPNVSGQSYSRLAGRALHRGI